MKSLALLAGLLISSASFAGFGEGHDRGNGGDALICKNPQGKITSAHFFDLYEAQEKFDMTLVPPTGATLNEKVLNLLDRVSVNDPMRALILKHWFKSFEKESRFKSGITLVDVPDTGDAFWPQGCELAQLVVQTDLDLPLNPYRYAFSQDIWALLDDNNKAATIVHELLWREGRENGHRTSAAIRYFNGLFQSDGFKNISANDYEELLQKLRLRVRGTKHGFPIGTFDGLEFTVGPVSFKVNSNINVKFSWSGAENLQLILVGPVRTPSDVMIRKLNRMDYNSYDGSIYMNGEFTLAGATGRFTTLIYNINAKTWSLSPRDQKYYSIIISPNGDQQITADIIHSKKITNVHSLQWSPDQSMIRGLTLKSDHVFSEGDRGRWISCKGMTPITIYTDEDAFLSCVLAVDKKLISPNGPFKHFKAGQRVIIDKYFQYLEKQ